MAYLTIEEQILSDDMPIKSQDELMTPFTEVEKFQHFNIDCGQWYFNQAKQLRRSGKYNGKNPKVVKLLKLARKHWGKDLWYENKKQRSGVVENFEAEKSSSVDEAYERMQRLDKLQAFYAQFAPEEFALEGEDNDHMATPWEEN